MSIYATIPGIGNPNEGDDETAGTLIRYRGSHILPTEDDPRGGSIGLALIPPHITRDGRDDQPGDGAPWPWLRLHLADVDDDPAVILGPAQARHLAAELTAWADDTAPAVPPGGHVYLSTGCLHGEHGYCQGKTGRVGAKVPATCKFCAARCRCECHQAAG